MTHRRQPKKGFPGGSRGKEPICQCRRHRSHGFNPSVRKIPWRRKWHPTPVLLPEKSHGRRSLVGYSPWGRKESDTTEQLQVQVDQGGAGKEMGGAGGFSRSRA